MPTTPFSTATAEAIAQAATQLATRLDTLEMEAGRLRFILRILHEGPPAADAPAMVDPRWVERWATQDIGANLADALDPNAPTTPAPAAQELTAWARRKAREAEQERAAARTPRAKGRKAAKRAPTKTPRPRNAEPLGAVFVALLQKKATPLSTEQLASGALAGGYQTVSNNFRQVAYMLLKGRPKTFRKGADGTWTSTKAAANG